MTYAVLHQHSDYSLLDGLAKVKDIAKRCKELEIPACSLTDHGSLAGSIAFYKACKDEGVKPIIGCEVYICNDRTDREVREAYHLVLLAKDNVGYQNLVYLCSEGHLSGFYHKPRIDYGLLQSHSEGLICLSACIGGNIPKLIMQDKYDEAEKLALWHKELFGDDFYLEVQNHGIGIEDEIRDQLRFMGSELDIKVVATGDSHYVHEDDKDAHALLLAMQTKSIVGSDNCYSFDGSGYHILSPMEMGARFNDQEIKNTLEVASKCNVELDMQTNHYPRYPQGSSALLQEQTVKGAKKRYGQCDVTFKRTAWERMQYELSVINDMGFNDYFLVVADFIRYAREQGIPVGAGRGSGAGSVVAYCCGITDICPLENGLLFQRFLNPDRVSPPDSIESC